MAHARGARDLNVGLVVDFLLCGFMHARALAELAEPCALRRKIQQEGHVLPSRIR